MSDVNFRKLSRQMSGRSGLSGSLILFVVLALVASLVVWSNFAELDNVTRGEGRVVSSAQNQSVQAGEGGVILRRYVSENSAVSAGDLLFEIDPIEAESELNQMLQRLNALEVRELRLRSEIAGKIEERELIIAAELSAMVPAVSLSEESLFAARRIELLGQVSVLEQRRAQSVQDVRAGEVSLQSSENRMKLLSQEISVVEPLVREKIAPATRLLGLRREFEEARGSADRARVAIQQANLAIGEIAREIENVRGGYGLVALDELAQVVSDKMQFRQALPRLEDRVSRTVIRAPLDGVVNTLNFRSPGGYVRTGDIVLELVPTGEALVVEGKIKPQDISRIRVGDEVRIRLSAYDSSKYGHVMGLVSRISADAVIDERSDVSAYYLIEVTIEGELVVDGEPVDLLPGMTASVDVLSGKRTIFEYIWQPVAKVSELALRD